MSEIDDVMYEDDVSLAAEAREEESLNFQRKLREALLNGGLTEVDLVEEDLSEKGNIDSNC